MDKKDSMIVNLLECMYYLVGLLEGVGYKGNYDFVWSTIDDAETIVIGKDDDGTSI